MRIPEPVLREKLQNQATLLLYRLQTGVDSQHRPDVEFGTHLPFFVTLARPSPRHPSLAFGPPPDGAPGPIF